MIIGGKGKEDQGGAGVTRRVGLYTRRCKECGCRWTSKEWDLKVYIPFLYFVGTLKKLLDCENQSPL
jgi:hypothetical protein